MSDFFRRNRSIIDKILLIAGVVAGVYLFIYWLYDYIAPFLFGYLISLLLSPLVNALNTRFKISRGLSALISILTLIVLIGVAGGSLVAKIGLEARLFLENIPNYQYEMSNIFDSWAEKYYDLTMLVPIEIQLFLEDSAGSVTSIATSLLSSGVTAGSVGIVSNLPKMLLGILLSIISSFFFIKDRDLIYSHIAKALPDSAIEKANQLKKAFKEVLWGYFKAQMTLASITAMICIIGLLILRSPYALFVGVIVALVDALPVFGSGAVFWPWAAIRLFAGDFARAAGLMIIYGVVFITRQMLEPRVLGENIGIHPLITLMSIYIGLKVFGVLGFIIGPVIVVITKVIIEET